MSVEIAASELCVRCQKYRALLEQGRDICGRCVARKYSEGRPPEPSLGLLAARTWEEILLDLWGLPPGTEIRRLPGDGEEFTPEWAECLFELTLTPRKGRAAIFPQDYTAPTDGTHWAVLAVRVWKPGE